MTALLAWALVGDQAEALVGTVRAHHHWACASDVAILLALARCAPAPSPPGTWRAICGPQRLAGQEVACGAVGGNKLPILHLLAHRLATRATVHHTIRPRVRDHWQEAEVCVLRLPAMTVRDELVRARVNCRLLAYRILAEHPAFGLAWIGLHISARARRAMAPSLEGVARSYLEWLRIHLQLGLQQR